MKIIEKYIPTIGLEIHAQLKTNTKAYSSDKNLYGSAPNTNISPVSLGHPGTLPVANQKVVEYAIKMGLAVGSTIRHYNEYSRKNYFYADLPKGYQITQDTTPICNGGNITVFNEKGNEKNITINRIHMEEDAGKSIHEIDPFNSLIDLNRAGVPLIEIVSEPEINSANEAYQYIHEIRNILQYIEICDGNMEEGSLRCDANISIKLQSSSKLGTKVEVKNMNSATNVKKAIEYEIKRQIEIVESGKKVVHETRSFNAKNNTTISMRHKEKANDYRYFPEPDIQPIYISQDYINKIKKELPKLPKELFVYFTETLQLSDYDAKLLTNDKKTAYYFLEVINNTKNYKSAANLINGWMKSYINEYSIDISSVKILPKQLSDVINLIDLGKINSTIATNQLLPALINSKFSAQEVAKSNNWIQNSDESSIQILAELALKKYPEKVIEYKNGKKGLIGLFMGEMMKSSKGKVDPKIANEVLLKNLEK